MGLCDKQLDSTVAESGDSALPKDDNSTWTLLPRPPLSFVEARSELHKWTGKYQTLCRQEDRSVGSNNEKSGSTDKEGETLPRTEDKTSIDWKKLKIELELTKLFPKEEWMFKKLPPICGCGHWTSQIDKLPMSDPGVHYLYHHKEE